VLKLTQIALKKEHRINTTISTDGRFVLLVALTMVLVRVLEMNLGAPLDWIGISLLTPFLTPNLNRP